MRGIVNDDDKRFRGGIDNSNKQCRTDDRQGMHMSRFNFHGTDALMRFSTSATLLSINARNFMVHHKRRKPGQRELAARNSDAAKEILEPGIASQRLQSGIHPDPWYSS